jgi:hypothetical protein
MLAIFGIDLNGELNLDYAKDNLHLDSQILKSDLGSITGDTIMKHNESSI